MVEPDDAGQPGRTGPARVRQLAGAAVAVTGRND